MTSVPTLDVAAARRHVSLLIGDEPTTWQVFADGAERPDLARVHHGTFDAVWEKLAAAQGKGCGVFVSVNQTDLRGRKAENITAVRLAFLDLDGAPLPETWPIEPTIITHSSNDRGAHYQAWWRLEPSTDFARWTALQRALAAKYDGDPKCSMVTQVGRVAGFWHQKNPHHPWQVKIVSEGPARPISLDEFAWEFDLDLAERTREKAIATEPAQGWDNPVDLRRAEKFLADLDNWPTTSNGEVSIFKVAAALRDLAVSPDEAERLIVEYLPIGVPNSWSDNHISQKVANAYRYASGDAGGQSAAEDWDDDVEGDPPPPKRPNRFRRLSIGDLVGLPAPRWLIEGVVPEQALVQLYGRRKSLKTFVTLDACLCVALGRPFHGLAVQRGRVTYVIGEGGGARFGDRVLAWCRHNQVAVEELEGWFTVVPVRVAVDNSKDLKEFLSADSQATDLIVFDTVARSMDGDENSTADMNRFIKGLDRVREHYTGTVLVVHHSGKDEGRQGRGSTALPGAVDATIKVSRKGEQVLLEVEEIRDASPDVRQLFEPVNVVVGDDLRSSIALRSVGEEIEEVMPRSVLKPHEQLLVEIYHREPDTQAELIQAGRPGYSQSAISSKVQRLATLGWIRAGTVALTRAGREEARTLAEMLEGGEIDGSAPGEDSRASPMNSEREEIRGEARNAKT